MEKRVVMGLLFVFILVFSFGDVSAASDDEEDLGFFGKLWNFFKGLFGWTGGGSSVDSDGEDSDEDGEDDLPAPNVSVEIVLNGPTEAAINETVTYVGSVTGTDTCTLRGIPLSNCSSFAQYLTFDVTGAYNIILAAGGESETIVLVVSVGDGNDSVQITLSGPTSVEVGEVATYVGTVTGAETCVFFGSARSDCASFTENLTFSVTGTHSITLSAGGNTEIITLVVEDPPHIPSVPIDISIYVNEVPIDDGTFDDNGWPTYLGVPNHCGPAEENKDYSYYWPLYKKDGSLYSRSLVEGFRYGSYGNNTRMSVNEVYAMPIYSGNRDDWYMKVDRRSNPRYALDFSLSECPGNFDKTIASEPENCFTFTNNESSFYWKATTNHSDVPGYNQEPLCFIEPGKRYFLNAKWSEDPALVTCEYFCSATIRYGAGFSWDKTPYIGPCLDNPPYPANYDNRQCVDPEKDYSEFSDGRCVDYGWDDVPEGSIFNWICTNGAKGSFLAKYTSMCTDGKFRFISGEEIPVTSNMSCEKESKRSSYRLFDPAGCRVRDGDQPDTPLLGDEKIMPVGTIQHQGIIQHRSGNLYDVIYWGTPCVDGGSWYAWYMFSDDTVNEVINRVTLEEINELSISFREYLPANPAPGEDSERFTYI